MQACALELTSARGFDGWTMDDLAEAADVSRRTVFNYFETKGDVVLGPDLEPSEEQLDRFLAGGPTGSLWTDVITLVGELIDQRAPDPALLALSQEVIMSDPHLIRLVHERFEAMVERIDELMRLRDGSVPQHKARMLSRLVLTVLDGAATRSKHDPDRPFRAHLEEAAADAHSILTT